MFCLFGICLQHISCTDIFYFVYPEDLKLSDFLRLKEISEAFILFILEFWSFFFFLLVTVSKVFLFPSPKFPLICLITC